MRNFLLTFFVSILATFCSFVLVYNYIPTKFFDFGKTGHRFGSSLVTIQGTDAISASRAVINANFLALNTDKIEATQTTLGSLVSAAVLATVGTITSGTWNGGIVFPTWGGTGSSTLSSNQVIIGNGTGAVKVVNGFGTSGQFLTSNGAGQAPSFQSAPVDQTQIYTWTNQHNFTSNLNATGNTYIKNFNASSTIAVGGVTYTLPTTQGASSTVLINNGLGTLYWGTATSTYASGTMTPVSTTAAATNASVITTGFQPMWIRVTYYVQGHTSVAGSNAYQAEKAQVLYNGTTGVSGYVFYITSGSSGNSDQPSPTLSELAIGSAAVDSANFTTQGASSCGGSTCISAVMSITNITSTGFTLNCITAIGGANGSTGRCMASWEAWR